MSNLKIKFLVAISAILIGLPAYADSQTEGSGSKQDGAYQKMKGDEKGKGHGEAYEHGEGDREGHGHGGHNIVTHLLKQKDKLSLTADQISALEKLEAECKKKMTDASAEHMAAHKEMHKLAHAETIDEAGMHALADKIGALKTKQVHAMVDAKIAALKILTPEQRKKMQAMHEEMEKKMEGNHEEMKKKHEGKK